jgi:hypothetical protein
MDAMEHGNSGDECEGRPGEERRFDERLPDAFPIARTRSRGRTRGERRRNTGRPEHEGADPPEFMHGAARAQQNAAGPGFGGDGKVSIQREQAWAANQQRMAWIHPISNLFCTANAQLMHAPLLASTRQRTPAPSIPHQRKLVIGATRPFL